MYLWILTHIRKINPLFPLVYFLGAPMFIFPAPAPPAAEYDWVSAALWDSYEARASCSVFTLSRGSDLAPYKFREYPIIRRK